MFRLGKLDLAMRGTLINNILYFEAGSSFNASCALGMATA